jgi:hypothetical protein
VDGRKRQTSAPQKMPGMASPYLPPPLATATDPVFTAADMGQRWRALMGPLGFSETLLWLGFLGPDRRMYKKLSQVPVDPTPTPRIVLATMSRLNDVVDHLEAGTTVALLLTRRGTGGISAADREWSTMLTDFATQFDVPLEPIFRANSTSVLLVEPQR